MLLSYLALGWGVQSFTLATLMADGLIPPVEYLIHADTGHEASATYAFSKEQTPRLAAAGLDVVTVRAANIQVTRKDWGKTTRGSVQIPAFSLDKQTGAHGQVKQQCTNDWKLRPIRRFVRERLDERGGWPPKPATVRATLGISADEAIRARDSRERYIVHDYPLLDMRMTRADCKRSLERRGWPEPPKSACAFCPYHTKAHWREMKRQGGADWRRALQADEEVRNMRDQHWLYVHRACVPLAEAVELPEDSGQLRLGADGCDDGVCWV